MRVIEVIENKKAQIRKDGEYDSKKAQVREDGEYD